jgi:hypothetical protein
MRPSLTYFVDNYEPAVWTNEPHVGMPSEPMGFGDETPQRDAEPEPPEVMRPRMPKSRRLEVERWGESPCRDDCFGCVYLSDDVTMLPSEELKTLKEMVRQSLGRIKLRVLAEGMHRYFEEAIRQPINNNLRHGERPLPEWPVAQIIDHIRNGNDDPLVQQLVLLDEVKELRQELLPYCMEESSRTGDVRPNKHNIECYERVVKLQLHIQKQDASKMAFAQGSANVNPEILSGLLSTHTKRVHAYLNIK